MHLVALKVKRKKRKHFCVFLRWVFTGLLVLFWHLYCSTLRELTHSHITNRRMFSSFAEWTIDEFGEKKKRKSNLKEKNKNEKRIYSPITHIIYTRKKKKKQIICCLVYICSPLMHTHSYTTNTNSCNVYIISPSLCFFDRFRTNENCIRHIPIHDINYFKIEWLDEYTNTNIKVIVMKL